MLSETITLEGHIIDSLTLSKVLDILAAHGLGYEILDIRVGRRAEETSFARIEISGSDASTLRHVLREVQKHGAMVSDQDAAFEPAAKDGVFPEHFYSTTNLETYVRIEGEYVPVNAIEMDCAIRVRKADDGWKAETVPVHQVRHGDLIVTGTEGVKVIPLPRRDAHEVFHFMGSNVSLEKPKTRTIAAVADAMQETRAKGRKILLVGGPAIIHTGAGEDVERIVRAGWIDVLFAGNGFATHDIECALYGTSLGVAIKTGVPETHGSEHHLRSINTIRNCGSIASAVASGILKSGVMHACVSKGVPFVLAGSIRDDGPLPDVITDTMKAQDAMRAHLRTVGLALMVASTLHSVAVGNLLNASVATFCVDANADTVIKLTDRGTHQAYGIVTDCALFLKELADLLCREG